MCSSDLPCWGYSLVYGCMDREIIMSIGSLVSSNGALYSHELTHRFTGKGDEAHSDNDFQTCGRIKLDDFNLKLEVE